MRPKLSASSANNHHGARWRISLWVRIAAIDSLSIANCQLPISFNHKSAIANQQWLTFQSSNYCPTSRASTNRSLKASCPFPAQLKRADLLRVKPEDRFLWTDVCPGSSVTRRLPSEQFR